MESHVIHILSPMVCQIREMHRRIYLKGERQRWMQVEIYLLISFLSYLTKWSQIVPQTVCLMHDI